MGDLKVWSDTLRSRLSGADDFTIRLELNNTIREFCLQSGALLRKIGPIAYQMNVSDYNLNPHPDGFVHWIHHVETASGYPIALVQHESLARRGSTYAYCFSPGQVRLSPTPTEDSAVEDGFVVWGGLVPELGDNTQVPDEFNTTWFDHILDGALGRMHSMHKKPWTNLTTATYHMKRFRNGISQARDITRRRFSNAPSAFTFPPWGNLQSGRDRW